MEYNEALGAGLVQQFYDSNPANKAAYVSEAPTQPQADLEVPQAGEESTLQMPSLDELSDVINAVVPQVEAVMGNEEITEEKTHAVDWSFIKEREGNKLSMYVPQELNAKGVKEVIGKSGNTIGMGIDLGQWSAAEFKSAGVSETLVTTLNGYFGLKNKAATDYLAKNPLTLTSDQVDEVNTAIKGKLLDKLIEAFDAESLTKFVDLTAEQQTAVASVFFQYGTNKEKNKWPKNYWKQVTKGEWGKAEKNLKNFGDDFKSRRNLEAGLLETDRKNEFRTEFKAAKEKGKETFEWRGAKYTTKQA
tara:strand:+ start:120 stop:1031 length:912 start_codon:yes stop_codon:yes gene_type:complete